jgi:Ni,Fe-hydrogenase I large subunit
MAKRITIDPITRIEGHLKIEVEIEDGKVKDAWSSGTAARGFEALLLGKDPRDAPWVVSRFCGICFSVHQLASARALETAFGAQVPVGGMHLRHLIMGAEYIYDHMLHFYHLSALDYIDIMAIAEYKGKDRELNNVKGKVMGLVQQNDVFPFTPRYKPDEYSIKDPDAVTSAVKHYLDALRMQVRAKNMGAIWGGRTPHYQTIVAGGFTQYPDINQVIRFRSMLDDLNVFVNEIYIPDVMAFGTGPLLPLAKGGFGAGHPNYLAYGSAAMDKSGNRLLFKPGVVVGLNDASAYKVDPFDQSKITESVHSSWYKKDVPRHPSEGEQVFDLNREGSYSFVKAPRYDNLPMELGPLARALVDQDPTLLDLMKNQGFKPGVVARHAARAIEAKRIIDAMYGWLDELTTAMTKPGFKIHDSEHWEPPAEGEGAGFFEAPRGSLGHWIRIKDHKIANYQAVVPSTWMASPRDEQGTRGQYEEALIGVPVPDPENPINVVRVIRSFNPCLACAVHIIDPKTNEMRKFIVE